MSYIYLHSHTRWPLFLANWSVSECCLMLGLLLRDPLRSQQKQGPTGTQMETWGEGSLVAVIRLLEEGGMGPPRGRIWAPIYLTHG